MSSGFSFKQQGLQRRWALLLKSAAFDVIILDLIASNIPSQFLGLTDFLFKMQAPVVRKLDNAVQRINRYPVDKTIVNKSNHAIRDPHIV